MMDKIKHQPVFEQSLDKIIEHYSKKDGADIKYVCTTDLRVSDAPADIFYRNTPHPEFGNRYFGLFNNPVSGELLITNADIVEEFEFGCVENDNGKLEYSESHHAYKSFKNGNMIDGGREYIRSSGRCFVYQVKDGNFIESQPVS